MATPPNLQVLPYFRWIPKSTIVLSPQGQWLTSSPWFSSCLHLLNAGISGLQTCVRHHVLLVCLLLFLWWEDYTQVLLQALYRLSYVASHNPTWHARILAFDRGGTLQGMPHLWVKSLAPGSVSQAPQLLTCSPSNCTLAYKPFPFEGPGDSPL